MNHQVSFNKALLTFINPLFLIVFIIELIRPPAAAFPSIPFTTCRGSSEGQGTFELRKNKRHAKSLIQRKPNKAYTPEG